MYAGIEEEYLNIGLSIFKMGPPRTLCVIGFIFWNAWFFGALYMFSSILVFFVRDRSALMHVDIKVRRIMGFANFLLFASYVVMVVFYKLWWIKEAQVFRFLSFNANTNRSL